VVDVSILIPTHNRSAILAQTLQSLCELEVPRGVKSELIVVANGCTDNTEEVVRRHASQLPMSVRCVSDPVANLNHARNRCIEESTGEILAFLDDDVWVESGWLKGLLEVYESLEAQVLAGRVTLRWIAQERPAWLGDELLHLLSLKDHGDEVIELFRSTDAVGANFSIRRPVANQLQPFRPGLDRTGMLLLSGGETEYLHRALQHGFRMFYAPQAQVHHLIEPKRLTRDYLERVALGNGRSAQLVRDDFGLKVILRAILGYPVYIARHWLYEQLAQLKGDERAAFLNRVLRRKMMGRYAGTWQRALGNSPIDRLSVCEGIAEASTAVDGPDA